MTAQYADLQSEATQVWEARQYRRRRLLSCIRGYLVRSCRPRLLTALALLAAAIVGAVMGWAAFRWTGLSWPLCVGIGSAIAWLAFVYVCWRVAIMLCERDDLLKDFESNIGIDEEFQAKTYFGPAGSAANSWDSDAVEIGSRGVAQGLGRAPGGLIGVLVVGLLTCGTWVVWRLISYGPELLAEIVLDGGLANRKAIQCRAATGPWKANALQASAIFFLFLTVVLILLMAIISCIPVEGWTTGGTMSRQAREAVGAAI